MGRGNQSSHVFDQEKVTFNLARLKKGGETFEIVVDPDAAIAMKEAGMGDAKDVVKAEKVFSDAKKGLLASTEHLKAVFGADDFETVAKVILADGEIQLTTEHRDKVRSAKRRKLIALIHRNAIDPKTGNPHPETRIELAFDESKVHVDEFRTIEKQLPDVVRKLQEVLPLRFEQARLNVKVPALFAAKMHGEITRMATIVKEAWLDDGHWQATLELPAGLKNDLIELLESRTHGGATIEEERKK